jgi:hypothetical protein
MRTCCFGTKKTSPYLGVMPIRNLKFATMTAMQLPAEYSRMYSAGVCIYPANPLLTCYICVNDCRILQPNKIVAGQVGSP